MTVLIVGNGLFGRIASDLLTSHGIENVVYDCGEPRSGTRASGNITKPSWVSGLGEKSREAYHLLDTMYGLEKFEPKIVPGKSIDLYFVPRHKTLDGPHVNARVEAVGDGWIKVDGEMIFGKVLVAAGVWSENLVPMPQIDIITGVSFIFHKKEYQPRFSIWAPYKQSISYLDNGEVWFGDGQAIKLKNWNIERVAKGLAHAREHGLANPDVTNVGYRPYVKGHTKGYFARVWENTWVSTGGGKNGIVLAAIQARQFLEELSDN